MNVTPVNISFTCRSIYYLLGDLDTTTAYLDTDCQANAQVALLFILHTYKNAVGAQGLACSQNPPLLPCSLLKLALIWCLLQ